jgi:glycine dehydrogenase subunit 1
VDTYVAATGLETKTLPAIAGDGRVDLEAARNLVDEETAVVVQSPNVYGCIEDLKAIGELAKEKGALFIVYVAEPFSLGLLSPPGAAGADLVTGEGQAFGNPIAFGGPYLGLFAARREHARQVPGRLVGQTHDDRGQLGYVLTLATREQHIRRARATSNICTNEGLCALAAAIHLCLLGPEGLAAAARASYANAEYLKGRIGELSGFSIALTAPTFNEFLVDTPTPAHELVDALLAKGVLAGVPLSRLEPTEQNKLLLCTTEVHTKGDLDHLVDALAAGP